MSRAVIDQAGFRVCFIGLVLSLVFGLALKSQIAPRRIQSILQVSISRLDKDFIIDFKSAEVRLSNWGLPLPYLEISQIRMSPKKASCQDSQVYIESLKVPLSIISLVTSRSLITEISASNIELRIAEMKGCLTGSSPQFANKRVQGGAAHHMAMAQTRTEVPEKKSIFEVHSSALLEKIKIDQLKVIYKNFPSQALDFRQVQIDLSYADKRLEKIQLNSQIYALKDPLSNVLYFKGDMMMVFTSSQNSQNIEAEAKLNGRLLDGELQVYALFNSLEQSLKLDFSAKNIALKPLTQLNRVESTWLNFPVALNFHGFSQHQLSGAQMNLISLKDIQIVGDQTLVRIPEVQYKSEKKGAYLSDFEAEIEKLNLNKLANLDQIKSISQSIENFGEMNGIFKFKDNEHMSLVGKISGVGFIFSNRGRREIQHLDSFNLKGDIVRDLVTLNISEFSIDEKPVQGVAKIQHHLNNSYTEAEARLSGKLLNPKIWTLLTQVSQEPIVNLHWIFKKTSEERHQLDFSADAIETHGVQFIQPAIQMLQSHSDGISQALALSLKASSVKIDPESLRVEALTQIFNPTAHLNEKRYSADALNLNLKGADWKNMSFEIETRLRPDHLPKDIQMVKGRGDWQENEVFAGSLSFASPTGIKKFELVKKENTPFSISPL